jgi:hypothetical protein
MTATLITSASSMEKEPLSMENELLPIVVWENIDPIQREEMSENRKASTQQRMIEMKMNARKKQIDYAQIVLGDDWILWDTAMKILNEINSDDEVSPVIKEIERAPKPKKEKNTSTSSSKSSQVGPKKSKALPIRQKQVQASKLKLKK